MNTIACFGEALVDFLARPGSEPGAPRQFVEYAGGAPANVAVAVARLGGHARFIGMLGADLFGDMLATQLGEAGVDIACVRRTDEAKTALAFVSLDAQGERSFSFYRPPAADLLFRATDFDAACFDGLAVFHVCSNSLTEPAIAEATLAGMRRARDSGALVSMDLNLRPALWPRGVDPATRVWDALEEADVIKLCVSELDFLAQSEGSADAVLRRLGNARAQCVLVTDGPAPIRWFTRTRQGIAPTFPVATIDTTAAGDAFVGGWLQALVDMRVTRDSLADFLEHTERLAEALRQAAACGALATTRHGAFAAMPTRAELERAFGVAA
jgi:fructokinase